MIPARVQERQHFDIWKILFVEDDLRYIVLLKETLRLAGMTRFEMTHANRLSRALRCLHQEDFDVVVLDLSLPDSNGLDTLRRVIAATRNVPVLVLTDLEDEAVALEALICGAQDYLIKGHASGRRLARAISFSIEQTLMD